MKERTKNLIKIISLIVLIIITIGVENFYREELFNNSKTDIPQLQKEASYSTKDFFKFITNFGSMPAFTPIFIILFLYTPIITSFSFMINFVYCSFTMNLLKMLYSNPRPFWFFDGKNAEIHCSAGYGNPSGHAMDSMGVYLSLWHIITDNPYFINNVVFKYFILVIFLLLCFSICLSRIYLGVHSSNQVIYGSMLGFCVYYFFFHVIEIHKANAKTFFAFFKNKKYTAFVSLKFFLLMGTMLLIYFYRKPEDYMVADYTTRIKKLCDKEINDQMYLSNEGLIKSLNYALLIGTHYGLMLLSYIINKFYPNREDEINEWNTMSIKNNFYKVLICAIFGIPCIGFLVVKEDQNVIMQALLKIFFPLLITMFNLYGPAIVVMIRYKIANPLIYEHSTYVTRKMNIKSERKMIKEEI